MLLGAGCSAGSVSGKPSSATGQASGTAYTNAKYNFSIHLPDGWSADEQESNGAQMVFAQNTKIETATGLFQPSVLVFTEPDKDIAIASYAADYKNSWIKEGAQILAENDVKTGDNLESKVLEYSQKIAELDSGVFKSYVLFLRKGGNFYIFMATTPQEKYNEFRAVFANMLATVK